MADLLVRGVHVDLVRALKARAGVHGRSAEAEHRQILTAALGGPRRRSFAEILASMPDVGADTDCARVKPRRRRPVYLIDTNVVSEARKKAKASSGVTTFFRQSA